MASRSNTLLAALANAVKLNPRLSAGIAFELGVMAGAYIKAARNRKGLAGTTAKLIDAIPLISPAQPVRRKPVVRRRKPARRAA